MGQHEKSYFTSKSPHFHEPMLSKKIQTTSEMTPYFTITSVINYLITSLLAQLNAIKLFFFKQLCHLNYMTSSCVRGIV